MKPNLIPKKRRVRNLLICLSGCDVNLSSCQSMLPIVFLFLCRFIDYPWEKNLWTSEKFQILAPSIIVSLLRTSNFNLTNSLPWHTIYIDSVSAAAKSQRVCQIQSVKRWKIFGYLDIGERQPNGKKKKSFDIKPHKHNTVNIWHLVSCNIIHGKPFDWILWRARVNLPYGNFLMNNWRKKQLCTLRIATHSLNWCW